MTVDLPVYVGGSVAGDIEQSGIITNYPLTAGKWAMLSAANPARSSVVLYNDGPHAVYLMYGPSTPSTTPSNGDGQSFKLVNGATLTVYALATIWACDPIGGSVVYVEAETN